MENRRNISLCLRATGGKKKKTKRNNDSILKFPESNTYWTSSSLRGAPTGIPSQAEVSFSLCPSARFHFVLWHTGPLRKNGSHYPFLPFFILVRAERPGDMWLPSLSFSSHIQQRSNPTNFLRLPNSPFISSFTAITIITATSAF